MADEYQSADDYETLGLPRRRNTHLLVDGPGAPLSYRAVGPKMKLQGPKSVPSMHKLEQIDRVPRSLPEILARIPGAEVRPMEQTTRQKVATRMLGDLPSPSRQAMVKGLIGSDGLGESELSAVDAVPFLGAGLSAEETYDKEGIVGAAEEAALNLLPFGMPAINRAGRRALRRAAKAPPVDVSKWDNTAKVRQRFIDEMGEHMGDDAFQRYAGGGMVKKGVKEAGEKALKILRGADAPGMISPRMPTAKKAAENPLEDYLEADTHGMQLDPEGYAHNVDLLRAYPMMPEEIARDGTTEDVANAYRDISKKNLLYIHDAMPEENRKRSQMWYDGANRLANDRAREYGIPVESTAGAYAALSPQKDWFQNVSLGDRVMSIMHRTGNMDFNSDMARTAARLFPKEDAQLMIQRLKGRRLADLEDPVDKALWVRAYDQTYNSPEYKIISPEGEYLDLARTGSGAPRKAAWGSLGEIGKAISSIEANGDVGLISQLMGQRHKVRSFYDNIVAPMSRAGALTGDTHAVAANQLRPLSGNSLAVAHNFKNSVKGQPAAVGSTRTGAMGTYGLNADAYRDAAAERGLLPRQMQSITWEGIRGLFRPEFKRNEAATAAIDDVWRSFARGEISLEDAQRRVTDMAGGFRNPDWVDEEDYVD